MRRNVEAFITNVQADLEVERRAHRQMAHKEIVALHQQHGVYGGLADGQGDEMSAFARLSRVSRASHAAPAGGGYARPSRASAVLREGSAARGFGGRGRNGLRAAGTAVVKAKVRHKSVAGVVEATKSRREKHRNSFIKLFDASHTQTALAQLRAEDLRAHQEEQASQRASRARVPRLQPPPQHLRCSRPRVWPREPAVRAPTSATAASAATTPSRSPFPSAALSSRRGASPLERSTSEPALPDPEYSRPRKPRLGLVRPPADMLEKTRALCRSAVPGVAPPREPNPKMSQPARNGGLGDLRVAADGSGGEAPLREITTRTRGAIQSNLARIRGRGSVARPNALATTQPPSAAERPQLDRPLSANEPNASPPLSPPSSPSSPPPSPAETGGSPLAGARFILPREPHEVQMAAAAQRAEDQGALSDDERVSFAPSASIAGLDLTSMSDAAPDDTPEDVAETLIDEASEEFLSPLQALEAKLELERNRYRLVRNRWQLYWMLYKNPVLRESRAHVLDVMYAKNQELKAEAKAAKDPGLLTAKGIYKVAGKAVHVAEEAVFLHEFTRARRRVMRKPKKGAAGAVPREHFHSVAEEEPSRATEEFEFGV